MNKYINNKRFRKAVIANILKSTPTHRSIERYEDTCLLLAIAAVIIIDVVLYLKLT